MEIMAGMKMEDIALRIAFVQTILDRAKAHGITERHDFESVIALAMEEYCKEHGLNPEEEFQMLADISKEINKMLGRYGHEEEQETMEADDE